MKKIILSMMMTLSLLSAASSAELIQLDGGGSLFQYASKYTAARNSEAKFKIDGVCISACTMITGIVPKNQVCATEYGVMAFHSATVDGEHSTEGTRLLGQFLSEEAKEMLRLKGWDPDTGTEHQDLIYIKARELFEACN